MYLIKNKYNVIDLKNENVSFHIETHMHTIIMLRTDSG